MQRPQGTNKMLIMCLDVLKCIMKTAMIVELETRFVLLWTGLFISLGLNVFICYSMSLWLK